MGIANYLKKFGKRKAGSWGRINHKRDMRAASKAVRVDRKKESNLELAYREDYQSLRKGDSNV